MEKAREIWIYFLFICYVSMRYKKRDVIIQRRLLSCIIYFNYSLIFLIETPLLKFSTPFFKKSTKASLSKS